MTWDQRRTAQSAAALWLSTMSSLAAAQDEAKPPPPNILWITCEDISPHLRCFGEAVAHTPHLDALAAEGVRYTRAFAPIGVCAPARSSLITGMYASSLGTQHMRCEGVLPKNVRCFTEYLRDAGYYCTNNVKTDYNFSAPESAWDVSSRQAHWRGRAPGQPFFHVINFTVTHEGRIRATDEAFARATRRLTESQRHHPDRVPIPPYHPDTPVVRRDWARYHDLITAMDARVGDVLAELAEDGLAEDTIVMFFSDHGAGMPRSKRWLYDSSTRVPLILRVPERFADRRPGAAGTAVDRLVSFVDFAPTVLSLAGVAIPGYMQGRAFLGPDAVAPRRYVHGFRDRMDERYDLLRSVRDRRYRLIWNLLPHRGYAQWLEYMYQMPSMREWARLAAEGALVGPQRAFMGAAKPAEELYDTWADPHEVHNLAAEPEYAEVRERLRAELLRWMREIVDLGLLPEPDLRARFGAAAPYDAVRREPSSYPIDRLLEVARRAGRGAEQRSALVEALGDDDPAVRWWGAVGLRALGAAARPERPELLEALTDDRPAVRVAAASAVAAIGDVDRAVPVLVEALRDEDPWVRLMAANALDDLDVAVPVEALRAARDDSNRYVVRVITKALRDVR